MKQLLAWHDKQEKIYHQALPQSLFLSNEKQTRCYPYNYCWYYSYLKIKKIWHESHFELIMLVGTNFLNFLDLPLSMTVSDTMHVIVSSCTVRETINLLYGL